MAAAVTLGGSLEQEQWAFFWGEVFGGIRVHEARRRGYLCGMRYGSVRHRVVGVSGSLGVVGCSALCLSPLFWGGGVFPLLLGVFDLGLRRRVVFTLGLWFITGVLYSDRPVRLS